MQPTRPEDALLTDAFADFLEKCRAKNLSEKTLNIYTVHFKFFKEYLSDPDKKASDIKVIDIEQITTLADYFIIASGSNRNQVQAMADNVDEVLGKAGYQLKQTEGYSSANWILLDYGDIVIHLFDEENRLFYDLERIWRDGKVMDAKELKEEQ